MKKEIYAFLSNFFIFLFLFFVLIFTYNYAFDINYLEKYKYTAVFFDSLLDFYKYFYGFFIFTIFVHFIFLINPETKNYLVGASKEHLFYKLYSFLLVFFIIGIIFTIIFNSVLTFTIGKKNEYSFSYNSYNDLLRDVIKINDKIEEIDIFLSSANFLSIENTINPIRAKKDYLEQLLKIYDKMRLLYPDNDDISTGYYLIKVQYEKLPNYNIEINKLKNVSKTYPFKNLTTSDFINIINGFINKEDYYTANYFAYIGYLATHDSGIESLFDLTLKYINEHRNFDDEKRQMFFQEKQKNFLYLQTENYKASYYGFLNLNKLYPNDNEEILGYKNKSIEKLREQYLFLDEIEKYFEYYGINNVFLFQDEVKGIYDYIYIQKIVDYGNGVDVVKNFELIRLNKAGEIILHIKIPFASIKDNTVYQNILDKDDELNKNTKVEVLTASKTFDKDNLKVVKIHLDRENISLFSDSNDDSFFLKLQNLISVFKNTNILNLKIINSFSLSLLLLFSPMILVLLGAFSIVLSLRVRFEFLSKMVIIFISLIIAIFSNIISILVKYFLIILISLFIHIFNNLFISTFLVFLLLLFLIVVLLKSDNKRY